MVSLPKPSTIGLLISTIVHILLGLTNGKLVLYACVDSLESGDYAEMYGDRTRLDCNCTRPPLFKALLPTFLRQMLHNGQTTEALATAEVYTTETPTNSEKITTTEEPFTIAEKSTTTIFTTTDTSMITENAPPTKESSEQSEESKEAGITSDEETAEADKLTEQSEESKEAGITSDEETAEADKSTELKSTSTEYSSTTEHFNIALEEPEKEITTTPEEDTSTTEEEEPITEKPSTQGPPPAWEEQTSIDETTPTEIHVSTTSTIMSTEPTAKMLSTVSFEIVPELKAPYGRDNMKAMKAVVGSVASISVVIAVVLVVRFRESCRRRLGHYLPSPKPEDHGT